jgi:hypothetical protein
VFILSALSFVAALIFAVFVAFTIGLGAGMGGDASMLSLVVISVFALGFVAVGVTVQFFDVAIVVDDAGILGSFSASLRLLLGAPLSVLGYTVLRAVFGVVFFFVPLLVATFATEMTASSATAGGFGTGSTLFLVLLVFWGLVALPVGHVVLATYHVAFFNRHSASGTV